ncbi:MAG: hypothetical protein QE271_13220 [Bacteriovoracaceae bacterium]|nr:hypothetical protein [Bacteriovoracaceae bacterium]
MRKWFSILCFTFACSSPLSVNQYIADQLKITTGVSGKETWSDSLVFTRASWYQRATLLYEILLADLPQHSPFRKWFSDQENEYVKNCKQLVVGMNYSYPFAKVPTRNLHDQMRSLGFKEMVSVSFERQIYNHADAARLRAKHYRVHFYCHEMKDIKKVSIEVPGTMAQEVAW